MPTLYQYLYMYIFTLRIPYAWARDISPVFAFEYKDGNVFDC